VNGSETSQSSALPQFLPCSSLPRLRVAIKATAIVADDVDEKVRFPSEAIELVKEAKFEATDATANDSFLLPGGQGTRTKSADPELKTEVIVRRYDDLDDGMAVVLGKLPLGALRGALRARRSGYELMTVKSRIAHESDSKWSELFGPHPVAWFRAPDVADANTIGPND
jgi:hypothetical protein